MKIFQSIPRIKPKNDLLNFIKSPVDLRKLKLEALPKLADESFTKGRMDNNIIELSKNDVRSILEELL